MTRRVTTGAVKYDLNVLEELQSTPEVSSIFEHKIQDNRCGVGVALHKGESVDSLLKRFKKRVFETKVLIEAQDKSIFEKPSVAKRKKKLTRKFRAQLISKTTNN